VYVYVKIYVRVYVCEGGLSAVLASSGHHRRRTVGMVGNDPVMTLTPRIVGCDTRSVHACVCVCANVCESEPSLSAPPLPAVSIALLFPLSSSRGYPWSDLKPR